MPNSCLTAKQLDVRSSDFSTSSAVVSVKAYDSTSVYDFYLPDKNPKFIDGVSGSEQVADQVLTYDVASDKYVWKQAATSELFLQGSTDTIGNDEHGNVLTVQSETRVVAGDPLYDPSKPADQQVYKVQQAFTDQLYNIGQIAAGKATVGASTYEKVSGMYFGWSSGTNPGGTADEQKHAKDMVTLTTSTKATGSEIERSDVILKPALGVMAYKNASNEASSLEVADDSLKLKSRDKEVFSSTIVSSTSKCYPGAASNAPSTLSQKPSEFSFDFGRDSSKFKVDNNTKKLETDMEEIEFGATGSKHRLKIFGGKLYIQKYDSGTSSWIGADAIIDQNTSFTATATVSSHTVNGSAVDITVALGGTGGTNVRLMIDDDTAGAQNVSSGATQTFTGLYSGSHTAVAWPIDGSNNQVGEKYTMTFTIA